MASTMTAPPRAEKSPDMTSVFHHAPIAGLVVDASGLVSNANKAALRLLQQPESAVIGHSFNALVRSKERLSIHVASNQAIRFAVPTIRRKVVLAAGQAQSAELFAAGLQDGSVVIQLVESFGAENGGATIEEQRAFRSALIELSELSHEHVDDAAFYDKLLCRAIEVVPGAQAGSILVRTPDTNEFHFVAANGFDLEQLQTRCLYQEEMFRDVETPTATINHDIASMELNEEQASWLAIAGRINEIVVNVSAPVHIAGDPAAFISLDNFDDPDAFSDISVEMTSVLGRLIADLIRRRQLEAELRSERESFKYQAMHDELTGLANRRQVELAFADTIESSRHTGDPFALFFIDIDDFKSVNDTHGHDVGDDVLVAIAQALIAGTRAIDLVGRWGGDEFMIVAPGTQSTKNATVLAQRVLDSFVNELTLSDGATINVDLSIGAVWTPSGVDGADAIMQRADEALYEAKHSGKNTFRIKTV